VREAQRVKMKVNRARFYGRELYIQYLPAMDSEEDIKAKFEQRVARVGRQIEYPSLDNGEAKKREVKGEWKKRKQRLKM
jgi:hypothetical protein